MREKISEFISSLAEYYREEISPKQLAMYVEDLVDVHPEQLAYAIKKYRTDPRNSRFPLPAMLKAILKDADGRPGVEEAWTLCPKQENQAAYVNSEIMEAWAVADAHLLEGGNMISARMAFKEVYESTVERNRINGVPVNWFFTRAYGPGAEHANNAALRIAVEKNRIGIQQAVKLLPSLPLREDEKKIFPQIAHEKVDVQKLIGETFK